MGKMSEQDAEGRWNEICRQQGWNEESQITHLEQFIRTKGLLSELVAYASEVAAEERGEENLTFVRFGDLLPGDRFFDLRQGGAPELIKKADGEAWLPDQPGDLLDQVTLYMSGWLVERTEDLIVRLADGWSLRTYSGDREGTTAGDFVVLCEPSGATARRWTADQWRDRPVPVMAEILADAGGRAAGHDLAMKDGETVIALANGMSIRTGGMLGGYVRVCDVDETQVVQYDWVHWQDEPALIMSFILTAAAGDHVEPIDEPEPLAPRG